MSVEALAAELRRVLDCVTPEALGEAATMLGEARDGLARAAQGSQADELPRAMAALEQARRQIEQARDMIAEAHMIVQGYLAKVVGSGTDVSPAISGAASGIRAGSRSSPEVEQVGDERAQEVVRGLPPPVPKPNPTGKKTQGRLFGHGGLVPLVSGQDEDSAEAMRLLTEAGLPSHGELAVVTHVEVKAAVRMIRSGTRHAVVAINNIPCSGFFGCSKILSILLPEGYSLTVHGVNGYKRTFEGGKKWSS